MNIRFFLTELKQQLSSFVLWFVALGVLLTVFLVNYQAVSAVTMETLLGFDFSMLSDEILENLDVQILPDLSEYIEYFAFFVQLITVSVCFYAASLGITSLSRNIGDGTIEFLGAQPVSRLGIMLTKLLSRIATLFAFNFVLYLLSLLLSSSAAPEGEPYAGGILSIFVAAFLSQLIFFMIGFCVSAFWSNAAPSASFCMALVFFTVLLGAVAPVIDETLWLRGLSPYHYSLPSEVIKPGYSFSFAGWMMLILGGGALFGLAYLRFSKRDLAGRG